MELSEMHGTLRANIALWTFWDNFLTKQLQML